MVRPPDGDDESAEVRCYPSPLWVPCGGGWPKAGRVGGCLAKRKCPCAWQTSHTAESQTVGEAFVREGRSLIQLGGNYGSTPWRLINLTNLLRANQPLYQGFLVAKVLNPWIGLLQDWALVPSMQTGCLQPLFRRQ